MDIASRNETPQFVMEKNIKMTDSKPKSPIMGNADAYDNTTNTTRILQITLDENKFNSLNGSK